MRVAWTVISGIAFTTLLVVLPMIHVAHWNNEPPHIASFGLAALPFVVIVLCLLRPSPWAAVWLFPVAHLPVLVSQPELTGPLVYSGPEGMVVLMMVVGLGALWIGTSLNSTSPVLDPPPSHEVAVVPRVRLLPVAAATVAVAIWGAFMWPVLSAAQAGRFQASAVVVGVAVVVMVLVSGRWVTRDLGELSGDARYRHRWTVALLRARHVPTGQLWVSLVIAAVGTLMVLVLFR